MAKIAKIYFDKPYIRPAGHWNMLYFPIENLTYYELLMTL
jgi:hypothetical protein